ncbi:hypothetical protein DPMN_042148 [Dreissena polymorpha]|uniref:BTB domain-containing protein n=1 Tax=Dreissena polymorpha TaxID=45954 RepID=A0A9D4CY39_DREPO|nr:hypothetical protein DPMN_042148 [Dreissena polymorpha]
MNAAVTKGSLKEVQSYARLCYNGGQLCDMHRRSMLHMAVSCGKLDITEWVLEALNGDVTQKDLESGWTALHRAVFYGQLAAARLLIQYKSEIFTPDHEGLGPLGIAMRDRKLVTGVPPPAYTLSDRHEVFTWGDNSNFTLGHGSEQRRQTPEVVDIFRKQQKGIRQIVMCKYHTVFLSQDGQVYTCGHGLGGRLGHQTEETCLVPKLVEGLKSEECTAVAASRDHTVFLTKSGTVYSCGMNTSHQLGQVPVPDKCLVPRPVSCKSLKGKNVLGLAVGRFHSVIYTSSAVFTCGLNAGQLGHLKSKEERKLSQFKQVSALNVPDIDIVMVSSSDAATVVMTKAGEIYVLHEYQCRKIASNRADILQVCVVGGNLDHTDSQILRENGGRRLVISYLNSTGKVFIWDERSPTLKRASWLIRRQLYVTDFVMTESGVAIVTDEGEVFVCTLSNKPALTRDNCAQSSHKECLDGEFGRMTLLELLMKEEVEELQVHMVPNVHRASYVSADMKGRNYAVLQSLPNACLTDVPSTSSSEMTECFGKLLSEADEFDLIHDLILKSKDRKWPVHGFIMITRCANFSNLLVNVNNEDNNTEVQVLEIHDIHPQIIEQVLQFIYTDTCDVLCAGTHFCLNEEHQLSTSNNVHDDIFTMESHVVKEEHKSAFEVINKAKEDKYTSKKKMEPKDEPGQRDPLKLMVAGFTYRKGRIESTGKVVQKMTLKFERDNLQNMKSECYDVCVRSEDGMVFRCHKCVLVARLEYFHSMLASGWMETSSSQALTLAVPSDILEILLDYLYTDESHLVNSTQKVELLCNVLVVADQMLVTRLKEMCEASIATLVTLKNVGELLEFSSKYNAKQLKATCHQFIVLNLAALLEGRLLDMLSDDVIAELSSYYRNIIPNMSRRQITPYDEGPSRDYLQYLASEMQDSIDYHPLGTSLENRKVKAKKKRSRNKSGMEETEKDQRRLSESDIPERGLARRVSESSDVAEKKGIPVIAEDLLVCKRNDQDLSRKAINNNNNNDNNNSSCCGKAPSSPKSPLPHSPGSDVCTHSLRDIMKEEETRLQSSVKTPSERKGKFSWKDVKKQKQQKQQGSSGSVEGPCLERQSSEAKDTLRSPLSPWGSTSKEVKSFRSLMVEDQKSHRGPPTVETATAVRPVTMVKAPVSGESSTGLMKSVSKTQGPVVSWGLPLNQKAKTSPRVEIQSEAIPTPWGTVSSPTSPQSPDNVWMGGAAQSPPSRMCSFSEIVKDEEEMIQTLTKASNKPLSFIQMEEQAIQDLLRHYQASSNVDERITVERVVRQSATPLWKRERLQSS